MGWWLPLLAAVTLQVEHARTLEDRQLGFMGREVVEEGMIFHFPKVERQAIWMFGVLVDLDLAFLDEEGTVVEVHALRAYPERMDPERPVRTLDDLALYPIDDPVRQFFARRGVRSKVPIAYALELPAGWLAAHEVGVGNRVEVDGANVRIENGNCG